MENTTKRHLRVRGESLSQASQLLGVRAVHREGRRSGGRGTVHVGADKAGQDRGRTSRHAAQTMKPKPVQVQKAIKEVAQGYRAFCERRGMPMPAGRWKKRRIKP